VEGVAPAAWGCDIEEMWTVPLALLLAQASAGSLDVYERAVSLVRHRYLSIDEFDAELAFAEAAEGAEDVVPWLIVEADNGIATLRHGQHGTIGVVTLLPPDGTVEVAGLDALPGALGRLEDAVLSAGVPLPEKVDLPISLLRGMARALDRHSVILSRKRLARFDERIKGKLSGIGARVGRQDGALVLKEVFFESPAAKGGLRKGDRVLRVDGDSTVGMSTSSLVTRMRGVAGSQLIVEVARGEDPEHEEILEVILTRAEVVIPNVSWDVRPSGVGVITIDHFSEQTTTLMRAALNEFRSDSSPVTGLVLDLRGNSGGSMQQACRAADLFLTDGAVLRTEGREGRRVENLIREYRAIAEGVEPDLPVIVLMDHGSASASEILAGSLALLDRAVLLGTRSHGKGTVQKLYTLRGGNSDERVRFKMTVARYILPGGVAIEAHEGLAPDVAVAPALFLPGGVELTPSEEPEVPTVVWVDERPGWRDGSDDAPRQDFLLALADDALELSQGTSRAAVLTALQSVAQRAAAIEDQRLVETFRYRGLDWSHADDDGPAPDVDVEISIVDDPVPGSDVEVRALVRNRGPAPLYRVQVQLSTDDPLPWDRLTLPVGFLPPGEAAIGSAMVRVGSGLDAREDLVGVALHADRRPTVALASALLRVDPAPPASIAVSVRLVEGAGDARLELQLENRGARHLANLRARVSLPEGSPIELMDPEAVLPLLSARDDARLDLSVHRLHDGPIELDLRVDGGEGRRLISQHVALDDADFARVAPPTLEAELPLTAPSGGAELHVRARDEGVVKSVTVWLDQDKVAWMPGNGSRLALSVPLDIPAGTHAVTVEARDESGAKTRDVLYIRGVDPATAGGE
jgi:carboxyl-terminal processing protease